MGHPSTQFLVPVCAGVPRSQPEAPSSGSPRGVPDTPGLGGPSELLVVLEVRGQGSEGNPV